MKERDCAICEGEGWVCEAHPDKPWQEGDCCEAPGMPCECNPKAIPHKDSVVIMDFRAHLN